MEATTLLGNEVWGRPVSEKNVSEIEEVTPEYQIEDGLLSERAKYYHKQLIKWRWRFLLALEGVVFSLILSHYSRYWILPFVLFVAPALRYASHVSSLYLVIKTEKKNSGRK